MSTITYPAPAHARVAEFENEWAAKALLSNLLKDLVEWLGTAWAMALDSSCEELQPAYICGAPPDRRACLEYVTSLPGNGNGVHQPWQLHVPSTDAQDRLPRLVAWSSTDNGTCALAFGPKIRGDGYTASDFMLILDAVGQLSALVQSERLARCVAASMTERSDLREDLTVARDVQRRFLPLRLPHVKGLDYCGESLPACGLGGDFFDFIAMNGNSLTISLGDVSGHGISSALLMSALQAYARGLTARKGADVAAIVTELNRINYDISPDNFFATMFYARFEPVYNRLQYVSAGHEPALLIRGDLKTVEELESTGTVLGLSYKSLYSARTVRVFPGDTLVVCTDGISERGNREGQTFSEGVLAVVRNQPDARACDIVESIMDYSAGWDDGPNERDDRTVVVVRVRETMDQSLLRLHASRETVGSGMTGVQREDLCHA